jgi:glucosamine--fructose-6-phosphate aminotransferase (isomerizing)
MCGIVGYIGNRSAADVLLGGLRRLEYRGYDSAGIAVVSDTGLELAKAAGKVANLVEAVEAMSPPMPEAGLGVAHTRWATHGPPTKENAHPHTDQTQRFAIVHNGIIENYAALKARLEGTGHTFHSETDTEVLAHLIGEFYEGDFAGAVAAALRQVEGTYGLAIVCSLHPGEMIVARQGSPIVVGMGDGEVIVASDVAAIAAHTSTVVYLDDGDIAIVTPADCRIRTIDNVLVSREPSTIDWEVEVAEKGGFEHFMLKEIYEQPESLRNAIRGRLDHTEGTAILSGLHAQPRDLVNIDRIIVAACGTSLHAGMVGEYYFEDLAGIVTEVDQAAEFRYRNPIITRNTLTLAISQSGETADTLAAVREAKQKGSHVASLCNAVGSTIARETGRGVYLHAGPEIGVASTKAFTCQVTVLLMLALKFARAHRLTRQAGIELVEEIERLPEIVSRVLEHADEIEAIAEKWSHVHHFFYIGRGYLYPAALEGALKLKEISYIHAEGYHAAELKHGPIALLEESMPVMALANDIAGKEKIIGNIQECLARKSPVILTATEGDEDVVGLSDDIIWVPKTSAWLAPLTTVVALQLFSYFVARAKGCEIDQPRNLAKSVTVE